MDNPGGGWMDFVDDFTSVQEALRHVGKEKYQWWQIVDVRNGRVVYESYS